MRKRINPIFVLSFFLGFICLILFTKILTDNSQAKGAQNQTKTSQSNSKKRSSFTPASSRPVTDELLNKPIIDLSGWQLPSVIDYDAMANHVSGAIIRIQSGSHTTVENNATNNEGIDKAYKKHIEEFQKRGIPVAVYAYVTGNSKKSMEAEAETFYKYASPYNPTFYWLDVEEKTMKDMNAGVEAFRKKLKELGAKNIGIYIGTYFMADHSISTEKFDAIWIPAYGTDSGYYESLPNTDIDYDLHQYTSKGWSAGINEGVDLNQLSPLKDKRETYEKLFGKP